MVVWCAAPVETAEPATGIAMTLLGSGQVRGELQRQTLVTGQSFAFFVHFEGPLLQRWKSCSDLFQVEIGCDARVTGAFDHCAELSVLELFEGPLQRIVDDGLPPISLMPAC